MSEQPAPHPGNTQLLDAPIPQEESWHHVAGPDQRSEWHPDLQAHAEHYVVQDIHHALHEGQKKVLYGNIADEPDFQQSLHEHGLEPDDEGGQTYWELMATYIDDRIDQHEHPDSLQAQALRLFAYTPAYLYNEHHLQANSYSSHEDRLLGREYVSYFNGLVRHFAKSFPDVRATELEKMLVATGVAAIEDPSLNAKVATNIHHTIRGAQHEVAFEQILIAAGREYRPAELAEDLKGVDFVVNDSAGKPLLVDVKASLSEIEAQGSSEAYAIKPNGKIVMFSMVRDKELNGKFIISPDDATKKAKVVNELLTKIEQTTS